MAERVHFEDGSSVPAHLIGYDAQGRWYRKDKVGQQGGHRQPSNPAPVSGPAQLSQRTDGGPGQPVRDLKDAKYGEERDYIAQQQGAPMAQAPGAPNIPPPGMSSPEAGAGPELPPVSGFNELSSRPGEPITAGANIGPGPGQPSSAVNIDAGELSRALQPFFAVDQTGFIRLLAEDLAEWGI